MIGSGLRQNAGVGRRWLWPGLVAGVAFLATAMVTGGLTTTAWAMPEAVAAAVGVPGPDGYGFAPVPLLVGVVVHLIVSVGLGAGYLAVVRLARWTGWRVFIGAVVFSMVEPAVAIWVVLHTVLPHNTFLVFLTAIPVWASVLGHCLYGVVLGLWASARPAGKST